MDYAKLLVCCGLAALVILFATHRSHVKPTGLLPENIESTNPSNYLITMTNAGPTLHVSPATIIFIGGDDAPAVEIGSDGNVTLHNTNLTEVSRLFWKAVSDMVPQVMEEMMRKAMTNASGEREVTQ